MPKTFTEEIRVSCRKKNEILFSPTVKLRTVNNLQITKVIPEKKNKKTNLIF